MATFAFIIFPDSWRRERSAVFQRARTHALARARSEIAQHFGTHNGKDKSREGQTQRKGTTFDPSMETPDLENVTPYKATSSSIISIAVLRVVGDDGTCANIRLSDCNPFPLLWDMASTPRNAMVVIASGKQ
jgi:hypothetical protein